MDPCHYDGLQRPFFHNLHYVPDSKVHGANMGPTWGRQDPGRPHVGPMNLALGGDKNNVGY